MLSKSIPERSRPSSASACAGRSRAAFRRNSSIHSGSFFMRGDLAEHVLVEPAPGVGAGGVAVGPAELVAADALELGVEVFDRGHWRDLLSLVGLMGARHFSGRRDAGGADPVAVGDGGQPLGTRRPEHPADRRGLGLAQLGELVGHVGDGAVLLAELVRRRSRPSDRGARSRTEADVARVGEHGAPAPSAGVGSGRRSSTAAAKPVLDEGHPPVGEGADGVVAGRSRPGSGAPARARSSYCWSKRSRPLSVIANTLAGRPRPRVAPSVPAGRGSRASTAASATRWSRWRRTAAGVRSRRAASAAAVEGPCSRIDRATRSRVGSSVSNSTTPVCRYCFGPFK